jgi:hypothetical protein
MSLAVVYGVFNKNNPDKIIYVGSSYNMEKRWMNHNYAIDNNVNWSLQKHIRENGGICNFDYEVLDVFETDENVRKEMIEEDYILKYGFDNLLNDCHAWGQICEHEKRRSICKECCGGGICEHEKRRSICKECCGGGICGHERVRSICKECCGGSICGHNKRRSRCKECCGGSICGHERVRSRCKECCGGSICEHEKRRSICKECCGGSICEHNKRRSRCKSCSPMFCEKCSTTTSKGHWSQHLKTKKHLKY